MRHRNLIRQIEYIFSFELSRFIIVGGLAASVHFLSVVLLVQFAQLNPLLANVFAFFLAFQVSYLGHSFFTFVDSNTFHYVTYLKLIWMQMIFFVVNEYLFYFLLSLNLSYTTALILVLLIMPALSFVFCKKWIFV